MLSHVVIHLLFIFVLAIIIVILLLPLQVNRISKCSIMLIMLVCDKVTLAFLIDIILAS